MTPADFHRLIAVVAVGVHAAALIAGLALTPVIAIALHVLIN